MRTTLLIGMLALGVPAAAHAGDAPRFTVSAEGGGTWIHEDDESAVGALRLQRGLDSRRRFRVQLGAAIAAFGALDAGLEFHAWPRARVSPFLGVGVAAAVAEGEQAPARGEPGRHVLGAVGQAGSLPGGHDAAQLGDLLDLRQGRFTHLGHQVRQI